MLAAATRGGRPAAEKDVGEIPMGEEGLADLDVLSLVTTECILLRDSFQADTSGTTYAYISLGAENGLEPATPRTPLSLFLIIDHSHHVSEPLLDMIKMTACIALQAMQPGDSVTVIGCGMRANLIVDNVVKGRKTMVEEERKIMALQREKGCDLVGAVIMAGWRAKLQYDESRTNRLFVLGMGKADNEAGLVNIVRNLSRDCIYTFCFAYGEMFNSELLISMATAGLGQYRRIQNTDTINDVFTTVITRNHVAGRHVRVCVRPRHKSVQVLEIYDYEALKEDNTLMIDIGDTYFGQTQGMLIKFSYNCSPGRKELLEVHVSHYDAAGDRHLRTLVLGGMFVLDETEANAYLPSIHVVDKVMKVNTAVALILADQSIKENDVSGATDLLNMQFTRLGKNAHLGTSIIAKLQEDIKVFSQKYDAGEVNHDLMRVAMRTMARGLFRE